MFSEGNSKGQFLMGKPATPFWNHYQLLLVLSTHDAKSADYWPTNRLKISSNSMFSDDSHDRSNLSKSHQHSSQLIELLG